MPKLDKASTFWRTALHPNGRHDGIVLISLLIIWLAASPVPQPTLTIAFGFFQVISTFNRLSLNWPTQYLLFFRYVSGFAFNHQWLAVKCWSTGPLSYSTQLLMSFSLPLVFGMVLICIMYLSGLIIAFLTLFGRNAGALHRGGGGGVAKNIKQRVAR